MRYCALASGSNGNSYYVGSSDSSVLIDIGISCKQVERRMMNVGLRPDSVKGIFITHEHSDHTRGVSVFAKRYKIPVYITEGTYKASRLNIAADLIRMIGPDDKVEIGSLTVNSFSKMHDAAEPCSFTVSDGQYNIAVITDIGTACENVIKAVQNTEVLILESNYDKEMLEKGPYPYFLKRRISGTYGHLSNESSLHLFKKHRSEKLRHIILSHLSDKNNSVKKVFEAFSPHCADHIRLDVATREQETDLFYMSSIPNKSVI